MSISKYNFNTFFLQRQKGTVMKLRTKNTTLFITLCLFASLLFTACGRNTNTFHLEGQFKNLNQGEFYIYNPDQGTKDTIAVNDGRFTYDRVFKDTTTLVMLFPNYSELPIFARPGAKVKMEGDATHLRDTQITGTPENESMTAFRTKTNDMMPPDVEKEAQQFINEHAESPVSTYLLKRYFLLSTTPDYPLAEKLCASLRKAQPQNQQLARLHTLLESLKNYQADGSLPSFSAIDTKGDTITNKTLRSDANVIIAWSSWNSSSQSVLHMLSTLDKADRKRMSVISICLDASPSEGKNVLERDSIQWPNICDSLLWQSPLLAQLGIGTLPANILIDKKGDIIARNLNNSDLKDKIKSLLDGDD